MGKDRQSKCLDAFKGVVDPEITMARIREMVEVLRKEKPSERIPSIRAGGGAGLYFPYGALILFQRVIDELNGKEPESEGPPPGVWFCPHGTYNGYSPITATRDGLRRKSPRDMEALRAQHGFGIAIKEARLCMECGQNLPSVVERHRDREREQKDKNAAARKAQIERLERARSGKDPLYLCRECDDIWDGGDLVPIRYCPAEDCQTSYNASDTGQNCEACNRPFTRKVTEQGCPGCAPTVGEEADDCVPMTSDRIDDRLHDLTRGRI